MLNVIAKLRARRDGDEGGFTLIELMVVVLIIAILIAIAIPTFLGARQRAQDKAAQSSLRNGLTAAKTIYTDGEDYTDVVPATTNEELQETEPSLTFQVGASDGPKVVSVAAPTESIVIMASESKSGECFWITDNTQGPGTRFASDGDATACSAAAAPEGFDEEVSANWSTDGW